jgi:hypothetical protein
MSHGEPPVIKECLARHAKHAGVQLRRVRGWWVREEFLCELKAGPAGGLRTPSGPATTRRSPGHRPHPRLQVVRKPGRRRRKIVPVSDRRWTGRRLVALPPGRLADLLVAILASLTLIVEPVLASPTTGRPTPPKRGLDPVQHDRTSCVLRLSPTPCRRAVTKLTTDLSP